MGLKSPDPYKVPPRFFEKKKLDEEKICRGEKTAFVLNVHPTKWNKYSTGQKIFFKAAPILEQKPTIHIPIEIHSPYIITYSGRPKKYT